MSDPQRRQVRVRRAPKIGVFLLIGAALGVLVAIFVVNATPPDPIVPAPQSIGFLALLLAPVGAAVTGGIALLIDRVSERRARTVDAEWTGTAAPVVEAAEPAAAAEPAPVEPDPAQNGADPRP